MTSSTYSTYEIIFFNPKQALTHLSHVMQSKYCIYCEKSLWYMACCLELNRCRRVSYKHKRYLYLFFASRDGPQLCHGYDQANTSLNGFDQEICQAPRQCFHHYPIPEQILSSQTHLVPVVVLKLKNYINQNCMSKPILIYIWNRLNGP